MIQFLQQYRHTSQILACSAVSECKHYVIRDNRPVFLPRRASTGLQSSARPRPYHTYRATRANMVSVYKLLYVTFLTCIIAENNNTRQLFHTFVIVLGFSIMVLGYVLKILVNFVKFLQRVFYKFVAQNSRFESDVLRFYSGQIIFNGYVNCLFLKTRIRFN